MTSPALTGVLLGGLLGCSVLLVVALARGWNPTSGVRLPSGPGVRRSSMAVSAAVVVAIATRWPVAGIAAGSMVLLWPRMFGAGVDAARRIQRVEALATWTESLRDSIAGSVGLEEAISHSVGSAPAVLQPALQRVDGRLRAQVGLTQALSELADELDDPSADLVIAALTLNATLRGPGLVATLSALSTAARDEIDVRRKIEEGRKALRRTAMIILAVTGLFASGLAVFSRDYVAPYSTAVGQIVLTLVLAVFAGGLMWIRSAADLRPPPRFLGGAGESTVFKEGPP